MTVAFKYAGGRHVVDFSDRDEAFDFVMEWKFGYRNDGGYRLEVYEKWGLPRPSSAPDHMELDAAIEEGLRRIAGSGRVRGKGKS